MDNLSDNPSSKNNHKDSGQLIDVSSSSTSPVATISPNAVRNRIGAAASSNAQKNSSPLINLANSPVPSRMLSAGLPGMVQRGQSPTSSLPTQSVERHLVRRNYEELSNSKRETTVGSRLATDISPDGSTAGEITSENFDSLSLQLSPQLSRRSAAAPSATVPSTPMRYPSSQNQIQADLMSLQGVILRTSKTEERSEAAVQFQAELKRTLESSNSTHSSLLDISAPVTKWKRAMSLPQNDFSRAMCHRTVAKTLAQNIRSTLRSSPSTIKESLAPGDISNEQQRNSQPVAQNQTQLRTERLISPISSPVVDTKQNHESASINKNNHINHEKAVGNGNDEDIWVLRDPYVEKLDETDRQWKSQQLVDEHYERQLQSDVNKRMLDFVSGKKSSSGGMDETSLAAVLSSISRKASEDVDSRQRCSPSNNRVAYSGTNGSMTLPSRQRDGASSSYNHNRVSFQNPYSQEQMGGEVYSEGSEGEDIEDQPSLLRPFSNLLSGRKGAYSKVPTANEHPRQMPSNSRQHNSRSHQRSDRQLRSSGGGGGGGYQLEDEGEDESPPIRKHPEDYDTDEETDKLLEKGYQAQRQLQLPELAEHALSDTRKKVAMKEVQLADPDQPSVLLEGVLFRCRYLGSTQLVSESQPNKSVRMMQAQEAVGRIKAPYGEPQPSTEVDLFISFEKVMVLSTNLQDIIMDHALKTISYVADLEDVVVLMTRRRQLPDANQSGVTSSSRGRQIKMLCHVFECEDAHHISDAIGEAFHLAYMAFLRANGIDDPNALREVDMGEENIGPQDIFNDDLPRFVDKNHQRDVVISKTRGEPLGIVVVESGWGSVIPTVVVANMLPTGPASRSGQVNIGDQLLSVNGISLVGLPMTSCQNYIKAAKSQTAVRITLIRCPPVTEVLIKRPDTKYQLGFSVHNGIICSLLRGGIAERGGVRVGHRIIEVNGESVVAVSHERIVNLLSGSIGEIRMKTMPMSIFRLLTGQDTPNYI